MLDAVSELIHEKVMSTRTTLQKQRFTFAWLAERVIRRQKYGKDTIIIITGPRRAGKSNWGLKLVRAYIKARRKIEKDAGRSFRWAWDKNFPLTREQAVKQASNLVESFQFFDEAGDQFYTQETMKRAQRKLIKFMNKSGERRNLTLVVWPDLFTLDPKIINMAQLLVIVPYRFRDICSFGFIYGQVANPLTYDKFGIIKLRKKLEAPTKSSFYTKVGSLDGKMQIAHNNEQIIVKYPDKLFKFLRSIPSFQKSHRFRPVDKRFEQAYIKNVKSKQLTARDTDRYVPRNTYNKLKNRYETVLFNLYTRGDMSYAQLHRLHISPISGKHLRGLSGIKSSISSIKTRRGKRAKV